MRMVDYECSSLITALLPTPHSQGLPTHELEEEMTTLFVTVVTQMLHKYHYFCISVVAHHYCYAMLLVQHLGHHHSKQCDHFLLKVVGCWQYL